MVSFILKNTLSENGGVTRGICRVNLNSELESISEIRGIVKENDSFAIDGKGNIIPINTFVSMNMWGMYPTFLKYLRIDS